MSKDSSECYVGFSVTLLSISGVSKTVIRMLLGRPSTLSGVDLRDTHAHAYTQVPE